MTISSANDIGLTAVSSFFVFMRIFEKCWAVIVKPFRRLRNSFTYTFNNKNRM